MKLGDTIVLAISLLSLLMVGAVLTFQTQQEPEVEAEPPNPWVALFDGETLDGWNLTNFGGEGDITIEDGSMLLDYGADLTGVDRDWPLPRMNYEVEFEAQKVEGSDFFVGLTFPIGEDQDSSLILGGWGGGVCGLSCVDGYDASENETTDYRSFTVGKWYKIRLRVLEGEIVVWINDEAYLRVETEGKKFAVRFEVESCKPFGLCAFQTKSAYRNIRARTVDPTSLE